MGASISAGNGLPPGSTIEAKKSEAYRQLGRLDLNGDNKISGNEVKFLQRLGQLGNNITSNDVKQLLTDLNPDERRAGINLIITDRLNSFGPKPTEAQLQSLVDLGPNDDVKAFIGSQLSYLGKPGDPSATPPVPPSVTFDPSTKKIKVNDPDLKVDVSKAGEIKKATDLAADVLDGNNTIDFDGNGKIDDGETFVANDVLKGNTYTASNFTPSNFSFDFRSTQSVSSGKQSAVLTFDLRMGRMSAGEAQGLRSSVGSFTNSAGKTFDEFAKSNGIDLNNIKASDLDKVQKFVADMKPGDKQAFVAKFMTASYAHTGGMVDQENVKQGNFQKILSTFPREENTGRQYIDCTFYAAISQSLLAGSKEIKPENVNVMMGNTSHDVTIIRDSKTGDISLQSNNEIFTIPKDKIKAGATNQDILTAAYENTNFKKQWPDAPPMVTGSKVSNDAFSTGNKLEPGAFFGNISNGTAIKVDTVQPGNRFTGFSKNDIPFVGIVTDKEKGKYIAYPVDLSLDSSKISGITPPLTGKVMATVTKVNADGSATGTLYDPINDKNVNVKFSMDASGVVSARKI